MRVPLQWQTASRISNSGTNMANKRRAWQWAGGIWLVLVAAGGATTLALDPGSSPTADDGPRDGRPSPRPLTGGPRVPEGCEDEAENARRQAGPGEGYAYLCVTTRQDSEVSRSAEPGGPLSW